MKVLEVEVTGAKGIIHIIQPNDYNETGFAEVAITADQLELFKSMLDDAAREAEQKE